MDMKLVVASGKGGTGKTTVATNLAAVAHCGDCAEICAFNAIAAMPQRTVVFEELCHACGGCRLACPNQAITDGAKRIGVLETGTARGFRFSHGRLDVGQVRVPPLIEAVLDLQDPDEFVIRDAPPGVTCPTVAAMRGSDYALLVTEPTPFGLHDLTVAVELARALDLPCGVVVNRDGSGDDRVVRYCAEEGIPLLPGIPFRRDVAQAVSRGELVVDTLPELRETFAALLAAVTVQLESVREVRT